MTAYIFPIKSAFLTFPILAFLITLPFLIYQYRKHKYVNRFRSLMTYSFFLYLLVSIYLVILPLPSTTDTFSLQSSGVQYYQFVPFSFISDIMGQANINIENPGTFIELFKETVFLQALFNGLLLLPLGIYLRYYFKKDLSRTIVTVFLVSLFFEITQSTGLYGVYNSPYRVFDVDDLILNTLGGIIGYLIAPLFTYLLPSIEKLDHKVNLEKKQVDFIRRLIAFLIDWALIMSTILILPITKKYPEYSYIGAVITYFIIIAFITNGKTIGKTIVKIKIKGKKDKLSILEIFVRYAVLYFGVFGVNYFLIKDLLANTGFMYYGVLSITLLYNAILLSHVLWSMMKDDSRLFYERMSKTKNIIIID